MKPNNVLKDAIARNRSLTAAKGLVSTMKTGKDMLATHKALTFASDGLTSESITNLILAASLLEGSQLVQYLNILFTEVKTSKVAPGSALNAKTRLLVAPADKVIDLTHGLNYVGARSNAVLSEVEAEGYNLYYPGYITEDTLEDAISGIDIEGFFRKYAMDSLGTSLEYVLLNGVQTVTDALTEYTFQKSFADVGFPVNTGIFSNATEMQFLNIIKAISNIREGFKSKDLVLVIPEYVHLMLAAGYATTTAGSKVDEAVEMLFGDRIVVLPDAHFPAKAASGTFGYIVAPATMTVGIDPNVKMRSKFDVELDLEEIVSKLAFAIAYMDDGEPTTYKGVIKLNYSA